jgi:osmotically-inducible protein OsmY
MNQGQRYDEAYDYDRGRRGDAAYGPDEMRTGGRRYNEPGFERDQEYGRQEYGRQFSGRQDYGRQDYGAYGPGSRGSQGFADTRGESFRPMGGNSPGAYSGGWGDEGFAREARVYGGTPDEDQRRFGYGGSGYSRWAEASTTGTGSTSAFGRRRREQGPFVGKGPKGYRRSDERIKENVSDELMDHPEIDASEIEVEVQNGEVTLKGEVRSRYEKRLAEDCVEQCSGVSDVTNQLKVRSASSSGEDDRDQNGKRSMSGASTSANAGGKR